MDRGRRLPRGSRTHSARGAAAVEFALVSSVLILIIFGVLQYGLYFHDTLTADDAVRAAARTAVVEGGTSACGGSFSWTVVKCSADDLVGNPDAAVKVSAPQGWATGDPLIVCVQFKSSGAFGFLPMPHGGYVHASLEMAIENTAGVPAGAGIEDSAPTGQDWSWC